VSDNERWVSGRTYGTNMIHLVLVAMCPAFCLVLRPLDVLIGRHARLERFLFRQVWKGTVVDPAPTADTAPRTVSMTWATPCDAEVRREPGLLKGRG